MRKFNQISLATLLFIVLLSALVWAEEPYQAKVVGISDGDTVKVLHNGNQVRIRLYGIDTPEKRQAFGTKAKQFTSQKVFKKTVKITPMGTDRYGRTVALVQMPGDYVSLNEALVWHGFAWVYRKYCHADFCSDWLEYENKAKAACRGLWSDSNPIPPWEFRRR